MWQEERRQRLRALLATFGGVSIDRVTEEFGVSRETIRRDLLEMEQDGELKRVRGGAIPQAELREPPYAERQSVRLREKRQIAVSAASLVEAGQTLMLDAGSTTAILSERLAQLSGMTIITNSVDVANRIGTPDSLQDRRNKVVLIGGRFTVQPPATFGASAINEIMRYHADIAFLSPFGLDARSGATSYDPDEAEIARAMVACSKKTIMLADYSKLGVVSRVSYCTIDALDTIILDRSAQTHVEMANFKQKNANIVFATKRTA
ncbi:DeoR/GlpR family DNA-binding transcription regulator [Roseinatronobacter alkalisoli]|uniref:DeoR/GlpR family DNA-binding transcription regulator n=1 Tax=Roseinatronobacter alkalisoli TaxID=3028235 RepID=A0ABT5TFD5_9RHOB|nr:DeoR/GlpR family DNA-binding transcription regulator [Roseinatronobacter sp. HJB301]MDD7973823.1 DeoR/GlpR family DNA-binding transcription regulator [Roseinatronobacter sp. HJB301]